MKTIPPLLGGAYFDAWQQALSIFARLSDEFATSGRPYDAEGENQRLHGGAQQPFDLEQKRKWDGVRFGQLDHTCLGHLSNCVQEQEMSWPDYVQTFVSAKGHTLLYKAIALDEEAERAAEIYRRGVDEMTGNSLYEWHFSAEAIRERVRSGDFGMWGTYEDGLLIAVNSTEFVRGQRAVHWIWGTVDPPHRGKGVWENIGLYMDKVIELTGAQYGMVWMATTHDLSQRMAEKAGWRPVGVFPGGEFFGGSDGHYYRHTAVWYVKVYGDAQKYVQCREDMLLTPMAEQVAKAVMDHGPWSCDKRRELEDFL